MTNQKEIDILLNRQDFTSPFNHNTDIRGFIRDIKSYLLSRGVDPKGEAEKYIKNIVRENGFHDPDAFLKKYIFSEIVYKGKNHCK